MTNVLGAYNPIFYAQEALIHLQSALGMANTIHRGFERERKTYGKGDKIRIRRPSTFTVQDAPGSAEDLDTGTVDIDLNYYRIVRFKVPDNELAFTGEQIIADHIAPAAYELARDIDEKCNLLYRDVPWISPLNSTPGSVVTDITGPKKILFDNGVPMSNPAMMFYEIDGTLQQGLEGLSAFSQWQGAGPTGVNTQVTGALGMKYGLNLYANQQVQSHTAGALTIGTALQLNAAITKGATTVVFKDSGGSLSGTVKAGDTFVIAGNTQRYAIAADATAGSNLISITVSEPFKASYSISANVTIDQTSTDAENLAYHKNAFALAMAPLPAEIIRRMNGAMVETVTDPKTGLSLRARMWYDGDAAETHVMLDALFGVKTLEPTFAVRGRQAA